MSVSLELQIRPDSPEDYDRIDTLTTEAFATMPYSDGTEAECIRKLRADGDLTFSFVAVNEGQIVGHIAFSPVFLNDAASDWYGLGPVSAEAHIQKQGIGSALIHYGLDALKALDARGCVLIGDPNYYSRFGFIGDGRITYRGLETQYVQWLAFGDEKPSGILRYSPGLE